MIQDLLAQAEQLLNQASALADEIGTGFTFRGLTYVPEKKVLGHWLGSIVDPASEDEWSSSWSVGC